MLQVIEISERLMSGEKVKDLLCQEEKECGKLTCDQNGLTHEVDDKEKAIKEVDVTLDEGNDNNYKKMILREVNKFIKSHKDLYDLVEEERPTRTRAESSFEKKGCD